MGKIFEALSEYLNICTFTFDTIALFKCVLCTFIILGSFLTVVSQFFHNWFLQHDYFFET